ncbi:MAG TPA: hypothetical protein VHG92_05375, partial [Afifellaceae bacterium]|nr:hypothetical protein [Afifellaceae bacterium]
IKTGYTRASGFNLVSSVKRDGRHVLAVVLGGRTSQTRNAHMRDLIETHLPEASAAERKTPMLIADTGTVNATPLPRQRPATPPAMIADAAEPLEADGMEDHETEMGDAALGYAPKQRPASAPLRAIDGFVKE